MIKKAQVNKILVSLILMVTIIFLFAILGQRFIEGGETLAEKATCKESVLQHSKSKLFGYDFSNRINCPTKQVLAEGSDSEIKETVAEELYSCWNQWGAGEIELFNPEDETFCATCAVINFEDKDREVTGLLTTLNNRVIQSGGQSYYEYLSGKTVTDATITELESQGLDKIDTSKPMSIVFTYSKDAKITREEATIWGVGIGTAVGLIGGVVLTIVFPPAGVTVLSITVVSASTIAAGAVIGSTLGGAAGGALIGYQFGHDTSADWDARILAVPYTKGELQQLNCGYFPATEDPFQE
jgi:hypothetical protein